MKEIASPKELEELLKSKEPVAIFFYMNGCGHCEAMHTPWDHLSKKKGGMVFAKMESGTIPDKLGVGGYPEFRLAKGGKFVKVASGRMPESQLAGALFGGGNRSRRKIRSIRNSLHRSSRRSVSLRVKLRSTRKSRR